MMRLKEVSLTKYANFWPQEHISTRNRTIAHSPREQTNFHLVVDYDVLYLY